MYVIGPDRTTVARKDGSLVPQASHDACGAWQRYIRTGAEAERLRLLEVMVWKS
jgi:hypothetical protein